MDEGVKYNFKMKAKKHESYTNIEWTYIKDLLNSFMIQKEKY